MVSLIETPTRLVVMGTEQEMATLKERFRYHPEAYWHSDAYQLWRVSGGKKGWDGYKHPLALKTPLAGEILRGRKDELLAICRMERFEVNTDRCLKTPFPNVEVTDITDDLIQAEFALDENQKDAVVQWLRNGIGVANMAVNAGKTATFAAAAAYVKKHYPEARFLYFTPSERLVRQVFAWMQQFLPGWDITQYGGGKRNDEGKDMVVATQAMLAKHFRQLDHSGWLKTFHGLLLDESHHCQSATAEQVILACVGYFRMGASDTTKEDDADKWNRIQGLCGPIRCTVTSSELIHTGRSAAPTLYLVDVPEWKDKFRNYELSAARRSTAWTLIDGKWAKAQYLGPVYERDRDGNIKYVNKRELKEDRFVTVRQALTVKNLHLLRLADGTEYQAPASFTLLDRRYDQAIMRFKERNQLIVRWVKYYSDQGWPTVVVATRTPHVIILDALLRPVLGGLVRPLIGGSSSAERDKAFAWFKQTPGAVLVASIIKEGISINEIKAGVIADPVADWELAKQIVGRFMRQKADNTCYLTWFVDNQHPKYLRNARDVMEKLEGIEGFTFYHPVAGPETIGQALIHKGHL